MSSAVERGDATPDPGNRSSERQEPSSDDTSFTADVDFSETASHASSGITEPLGALGEGSHEAEQSAARRRSSGVPGMELIGLEAPESDTESQSSLSSAESGAGRPHSMRSVGSVFASASVVQKDATMRPQSQLQRVRRVIMHVVDGIPAGEKHARDRRLHLVYRRSKKLFGMFTLALAIIEAGAESDMFLSTVAERSVYGLSAAILLLELALRFWYGRESIPPLTLLFQPHTAVSIATTGILIVSIIDTSYSNPAFLTFRVILLALSTFVLRRPPLYKTKDTVQTRAQLALFKRTLVERRHELIGSVFLAFVLLVYTSCLVYFIEHEECNERCPLRNEAGITYTKEELHACRTKSANYNTCLFSSIPMAMWWCVSALTTVGYGDIYPTTVAARTIASFASILGLLIFTLPAGIITSGFVDAAYIRDSKLRSLRFLAMLPPQSRSGKEAESARQEIFGRSAFSCPVCAMTLGEDECKEGRTEFLRFQQLQVQEDGDDGEVAMLEAYREGIANELNDADELEFIRALESPMMEYAQGLLIMTIVAGRDLAARDSSGFSDPYCVVSVGDQTKKTRVVSRNLNPQWNQTFVLLLFSPEQVVEIEVYDWDFSLANDELGNVHLSVGKLAKRGRVDRWLPLNDVESGEIHVRITTVTKYRKVSQWKRKALGMRQLGRMVSGQDEQLLDHILDDDPDASKGDEDSDDQRGRNDSEDAPDVSEDRRGDSSDVKGHSRTRKDGRQTKTSRGAKAGQINRQGSLRRQSFQNRRNGTKKTSTSSDARSSAPGTPEEEAANSRRPLPARVSATSPRRRATRKQARNRHSVPMNIHQHVPVDENAARSPTGTGGGSFEELNRSHSETDVWSKRERL